MLNPTERSNQPPGGITILADDVWTPGLYADETANDSDKTIDVATDEIWQILWIWVEFTTTATAGNRQIVVELLDDAADVIGRIIPGITQAASLTNYYMFAPALADLLGLRDTDYLMTHLPPTLILPEDFSIRIYDNNAVDAAADDMIIQMGYASKAE